jgi:hypothetical protein
MMRDLYSSLTAREQRAIRWSGGAPPAAPRGSTAGGPPTLLLTRPLIGGGYFVWLKQSRRRGPQEPDDADWDY